MNDDSSQAIVRDLRDWLATAEPGSRLPTTRAMVAQFQASPVTVQKALRQLVAEALVESRPGVGTFVRAGRSLRPPDYGWQTAALRLRRSRIPTSTTMRTASNEVIALHAGYPDRELLPERLVRGALARASRGPTAVTRAPVGGLPDLQSWFAAELGEATPRGVAPPTAGDTIVLPGSQSGLSSVFRALVGTDQPMIIESPTYWGAISAAAQAGVRLIPIPTGRDGPEPHVLERAFDESGARAFYAQPNYANPTGVQWSVQRAEAVLEVVRRQGAFLVEDDWAHDFGITTTPRPVAAHDDAGHVVYLRSLTKSVSPALRIAAVIVRGPARERILADRAAEGMYVSGVLQAAALEVVTQPGWRTHLRGLRDQLRARRDLLVSSLDAFVPSAIVDLVPTGGLNVWARLPDGTDVEQVSRRCEQSGVLVAPGDEWFPAEPAGPFVRLNYSGPDPARFEAGARVLGDVLAQTEGLPDV